MRTDLTLSEQGDFAEGYVEAMLWANTYADGPDGIAHPDELGIAVTLSPEAQETLWADCVDFLTPAVVRLLGGAFRRGERYQTYSLAGAGHDFALTRNHHGAGFWDRGFGLVGEALTEHAQRHGERNLWVDSEGVAHVE